jgi:TRAP-type mannitol/chloroaromatic compound transport system substrate-binding protein
VPPFEVLDATNKKVIDGWHSISYYWVGKSPAAALFAAPPGGPFGMDHMDWLGWLYVGGGLEMWRDFYQNELKLNVIVWPAQPSSPQALGWFKKPLKSVADFKGMKCRQTGLNAEVYAKLGMAVVNLPGGEIVPAAQRGVIDCAEWVGGIEDLRLGLPGVFKYHYTPGMHENNSVGEFGFNLDVWKTFTPQQQRRDSAVKDTFITGLQMAVSERRRRWRRWIKKHGVRSVRTPPDILLASLKAWDEVAAENSGQVADLQEGVRVAARLRAKVGAGQALHVPAGTPLRRTTTGRGGGQAAAAKRRRNSRAAEKGAATPLFFWHIEPWIFRWLRRLPAHPAVRVNRLNSPMSTGVWVAWLNVPLVLAVAWEVISRLCLQRADDLVVRRHLHAVQRDLHAGLRLRAAQGRAHPHRFLL